MKVLLINSPIKTSQVDFHLSELLGIEYLAASVREACHEVKVWDTSLAPPVLLEDNTYYHGVPDEAIAQRIRLEAPDVVGISCHYAFSAQKSYAIAHMAKVISPSIVTVMGGMFASVNTTQVLLDCPDLDFALCGEADHSLVHLLDVLRKKEEWGLVDGLIYREAGGGVTANPKSRFIEDLDSLPFPARDLVDIVSYSSGGFKYQNYGLGYQPSLSILTSRSCPMRCTFCNMKLVHGPRWRSRSADNCLAEIEEMIFKYGARHIYIMDDNFTHHPERAKEFCLEVVRRGLRFRWNTPNGISVKGVDKELAQLMKRSGCANVCVAIESGSERIRHKLMNKKTHDREIIQAIESFHWAGIPVVGYVLLGMPGETLEENRKAIDFVKKLPLTSIVVSFVMPFPGTRLFSDLVQAGKLAPQATFGMDDYKHPVIENEAISTEQFFVWKEELRSHFPRLGILRELEQKEELAGYPGAFG